MEEVLIYFPVRIKYYLKEIFDQNEYIISNLEEIRIRAGKEIVLKMGQDNKILNYIVSQQELLELFESICENSIYSYKNQICEGYITIKGGHRVGITGNVVAEENKVININYISSLNFRIARQKNNCSKNIITHIINEEMNTIYNTLIVSPPGGGKTTVLKDIVRQLSDGIKEISFKGKTVGVVDERGEIAAMYKGIPQNDIGVRTDVISNINKSKGMHMLIRSMSPEIIVCDEIGSQQDILAINYAICCGIKGIFTAHAGSFEELMLNPELENLINTYMIERIIFLNSKQKGGISKIYYLDTKNKEYSSKIIF